MEILDKSIRFINVKLVRKRGESFIILKLTFKFITLAAFWFYDTSLLYKPYLTTTKKNI